MSIKAKNFMGEKIQYEDGIGCCIWECFGEDDNAGIAFDFDYNNIDELIDLLQQLKIAKPTQLE